MKKLRITVEGKTYDVTVEVLDAPQPQPNAPNPAPAISSAPLPSVNRAATAPQQSPQAASPGAILSPMAGVIKAVEVQPGAQVAAGQVLVLLEAMKLENRITAPSAGTVQAVHVSVGDSVGEGQLLLVLE
jgi:biotin carboxyl carrier protein